ncbi:MAG TPA: hypothetical protein VD887_00635 [Allosphingosinicella sp.]|nr:hypothetical protein [Allosphingosinicella sp.]
MIGLLLASLLQSAPAAATPSSWQEFDRRQNGFGETAFLYSAPSVHRNGAVLSAWVTYDFHYSGLPTSTNVELWRIDCAARRSRVVQGFTIMRELPVRPWRRGGGLRPFAPDSPQAALAVRLCG